MREKKIKFHGISELPIFMPQCQAIANHLISEIKNGIYKPGQKLKSVRVISSQYGVGRQIALSAIQILARNDYVYTEKGSGTFVKHDLKPGRYGRIGLFINRVNPAYAWEPLESVAALIGKEDFTLLLGSNFEEEFTLADWLLKKKELDGVLLDGLIDEKCVRSVAASGIPYVVMGNYDIDQRHPQVTADMKEIVSKALFTALKDSKCKIIGAVTGTLEMRSDREAFEGIKDAIGQAGLRVFPNLIRSTAEDGYADVAYLIENAAPKPDFIFFQGEHAKGFVKYCENHPDFVRPRICINNRMREYVPRDLWDVSIKCFASSKVIAIRSTKMLLKLIRKKTNN